MKLDVKYKNRESARPRAEPRLAWLEVGKSDIE